LRSVKNASVNTAAIVRRRKKLRIGTSSRHVSSIPNVLIPSVRALAQALLRGSFGAAVSAGRSLAVLVRH
jgi:hypothetical protein